METVFFLFPFLNSGSVLSVSTTLSFSYTCISTIIYYFEINYSFIIYWEEIGIYLNYNFIYFLAEVYQFFD